MGISQKILIAFNVVFAVLMNQAWPQSSTKNFVQEIKLYQAGVYSGQNQNDPYYIHREPHRDHSDYQLYLLCPHLINTQSNQHFTFNNNDIYNHLTESYRDSNELMHIVDSQGLDCIHLIGTGWVKIDKSAYPIFYKDEADTALSLTTQIAIAMIPATYVGRAVFTATGVGFQAVGGVTLKSQLIALGTAVVPATATELLSLYTLEQINILINQASDKLKPSAIRRLSVSYLSAGKNQMNPALIVGEGIDKTEFSITQQVTLGENVRVLDVASKLHCYFGSGQCLGFQKNYLRHRCMNADFCAGESDINDLSFVKVWYDHRQAMKDMPTIDHKLQKKFSTNLGLAPYIANE